MRNSRQNRRRRGMGTVEFALIAPSIFILFMGIIETGNMLSAWMTIQKAAQSGARFAATGIGDEEGNRLTLIKQETKEWLEALGGNKLIEVKSWPTLSATGDGATGNPGGPCQLVEVEVIYDYKPITPVLSAVFPDFVKLTGHDRKLNEPWKPCDG